MSEFIPYSQTRTETFYRFLYVCLFAMIYSVAEIVLAALVVLQFGFAFVCEKQNLKLNVFGSSLVKYIYQILQFVTFQSDTRPFPFTDWPAANGDPVRT